MGKKKNSKKIVDFKNDPFKTVKGFSVSAPQPPIVDKTVAPTPAVKHDHEVDFDQAMAQLGVKSLAGENNILRGGAKDEDSLSAEVNTEFIPERKSVVLSDKDLFLESLGDLDRVFKDDYVDGDDANSATAEPRRMKQLRKGKIKPQTSLDLHGCYRDEARQRVRYFLQNSYADGLHTVLIVTGKGTRSPSGEGVLRADIETYLSEKAAAWVAEWGRAPRQYGGDGALVVFLRHR
jgi:DNA-nicking Smr family endonuclease